MMKLVLHRIAFPGTGTYGVLIDGTTQIPFAVTLELPWINNERGISCIPFGWYNCKRVISPTHGETFQVMDVCGRDHILFHKGNITANTEGCILVGEAFDPVLGENGIVYSGRAFREFMHKLKDVDHFQLEIKG